MHRSTLHLAVYLFDRFLSVIDRKVGKDDLQIIGVSCLLIAGKTEEISPPSLRSYAEMTDYLCTTQTIARWELDILLTLRWHLVYATPPFWIGLFVHCGKLTHPRIEFDEVLMLEIVDLALFTPTHLLYNTSVIAACALWMATEDIDLVHKLSGHSIDELQDCYTWLNGLLNETPTVLDLPNPHASEDAIDQSYAANTAILYFVLDQLRD